ncbi:MAG TPA: trypsin-like serine protease [Candidatus Acidoferrales bacterium]|nr:trypsin-like serine protease [Candidatus Acidoferrales bacterium]
MRFRKARYGALVLATVIAAVMRPHMSRGDAGAASTVFYPRIVNGLMTASYPSTGALLMYDDTKATSLNGLCSGALIGCHTFLTAAHCVCPDNSSDAASCERFGITDPATLRVFLQDGGMFSVSSVELNPEYNFAVSGDVAIVTLSAPVTGVAPSPINQSQRLTTGAGGTIVGFGTTSAARRAADDAGLKRQGTVTLAQCPSDLPSDTQICWNFSGTAANTCEGDSGGPLFADFGSGSELAGVTSGGNSQDCLAPDVGFDSDVFVNRAWIAATAGSDLGSSSCTLPAVGSASTTSFATTGQLSGSTPQSTAQFDVPAGTTVLRIALNAQLGSASGSFNGTNDFDLYVRAGSAPTLSTYDCADLNPSPFGFCEITSPQAGTWHVLVDRAEGDGTFQVTATTYSTSIVAACPGDCNGDGTVTVDEVLEGVRILLGDADMSVCPVLDSNGDGVITVDELLASVSSLLNGCSAS